MTKRKITKRVVTTRAQLDKLIEEATVDCHDEDEQTSGFFNLIEDALAVPFVTRILGVEVSVVAVEMGEGGSLKAVCEHGGERQPIACSIYRLSRNYQPAHTGLLPIDVVLSKGKHLKASRIVFNIKGNDYRLVARVQYQAGVLLIRFFGTHAEYDQIDAETV
jgi:HigB_toxin, RelE-like toxic component of a toxin-antitoxin system